MSTAAIASDSLSRTIEFALSQPPSTAGNRLRSERDLASMLQTSHASVRKSLDALVDRGLLVRRRGSGTYVRRVPPVPPHPGGMRLPIAPSDLFADADVTEMQTSPLRPTSQQCQLQIGLWTDFSPMAEPGRQSTLAGIIKRVEEEGHRVTVHSLRDRFGTDLTSAELARRLANTPSDGYLVVAWWAERFQRALGERQAPVVFFQDSSTPIEHEPLVMIDTLEAVTRAVRLLAKEKHRRIGLLGVRSADDPEELVVREQIKPMQTAYRRAMEDAGLDYFAAEFCEPSVKQCMTAARRLLTRPDPPEALYIADDYVFNGAMEAFTLDGIVPGRDLGVIAFSVGQPLPPGYDWSCLEFDAEGYGEVIVNSLLHLVQTAGTRANSHAIYATWKPGKTHLRLDTQSDRGGGSPQGGAN